MYKRKQCTKKSPALSSIQAQVITLFADQGCRVDRVLFIKASMSHSLSQMKHLILYRLCLFVKNQCDDVIRSMWGVGAKISRLINENRQLQRNHLPLTHLKKNSGEKVPALG